MLKKTLLRNLTLACAASLAMPALAADMTPVKRDVPTSTAVTPDGNRIVARVNGVPLTAGLIDLLRESGSRRGQPPQGLTEEHLVDTLVNTEILVQEAVRKGKDKNPALLAALELQRKELLSNAMLEEFVETHPVSDERIKAEYDKVKKQAMEQGDGKEYHARHILVDDEKTAKDIIAKLGDKKAKAKFEDLAKKQSKDSSAKSGGDLGWMSPASLVPEFAEAMTRLKKGEYTKTPVKTRFGWHVIKLEESRQMEFPELDKVKNRIASQLTQQDLRKYLAEMRASAKVEVIPPPKADAPAK